MLSNLEPLSLKKLFVNVMVACSAVGTSYGLYHVIATYADDQATKKVQSVLESKNLAAEEGSPSVKVPKEVKNFFGLR